MAVDGGAHHREPEATYRRRRVVVALGILVVLAAVIVAVRWLAVDEVAAIDASAGATGTSAPPATTGPSTGTPATTALAIPGFATPDDYLACVRQVESRDDYTAVSPDGAYFGAYQIDQVTWNNTVEHAGLTGLAGVQPNLALPADQDRVAMALLEWQGTSPWAGDC